MNLISLVGMASGSNRLRVVWVETTHLGCCYPKFSANAVHPLLSTHELILPLPGSTAASVARPPWFTCGWSKFFLLAGVALFESTTSSSTAKPIQQGVKNFEPTAAIATGGKRWLPNLATEGYGSSMSGVSAKQIKRLEGDARMAALEIAGRSPAEARAQQTRVSLVGDGRKWRITNLQKAVRVMASWR